MTELYPSKIKRDLEFSVIVRDYFDYRMTARSKQYLQNDLRDALPYIVLRFNEFFKTPMRAGDIEFVKTEFADHIDQCVNSCRDMRNVIFTVYQDNLNDLVAKLANNFAENLPDYKVA